MHEKDMPPLKSMKAHKVGRTLGICGASFGYRCLQTNDVDVSQGMSFGDCHLQTGNTEIDANQTAHWLTGFVAFSLKSHFYRQ